MYLSILGGGGSRGIDYSKGVLSDFNTTCVVPIHTYYIVDCLMLFSVAACPHATNLHMTHIYVQYLLYLYLSDYLPTAAFSPNLVKIK